MLLLPWPLAEHSWTAAFCVCAVFESYCANICKWPLKRCKRRAGFEPDHQNSDRQQSHKILPFSLKEKMGFIFRLHLSQDSARTPLPPWHQEALRTHPTSQVTSQAPKTCCRHPRQRAQHHNTAAVSQLFIQPTNTQQQAGGSSSHRRRQRQQRQQCVCCLATGLHKLTTHSTGSLTAYYSNCLQQQQHGQQGG